MKEGTSNKANFEYATEFHTASKKFFNCYYCCNSQNILEFDLFERLRKRLSLKPATEKSAALISHSSVLYNQLGSDLYFFEGSTLIFVEVQLSHTAVLTSQTCSKKLYSLIWATIL